MSQDLLVIVADGTMKKVIDALLDRDQAFQIRKIQSKVEPHPHNDPGVRLGGVQLAKTFCSQHDHVLLMFDHYGSGANNTTAENEESRLETELQRNGWNEHNSAVIVFEPELESWIWSDSPHVGNICGWKGSQLELKDWLIQNGHCEADAKKPTAPKKALREFLKTTRTPFSSSIHKKIAEKVSFQRCTDRAFKKFKTTLKNWFSE